MENVEFNNLRSIYSQARNARRTIKDQVGDNEDLAVLLISLLRGAEIDAYPVLTRYASNGPAVTDFPYPGQFNHVVVLAELGKMQIFLDPTVSSAKIDEVFWEIQNTQGLVLKEKEVDWVELPSTTYTENTKKGSHTLSNIETGNPRVLSQLKYSGICREFLDSHIDNTLDDQKDWLVEVFSSNIPQVSIDTFHISSDSIYADLTAGNYTTLTKSRLIINPNIFRRQNTDVLWNEVRERDIYFLYPMYTEDRIYIEIPNGYAVEFIPEPLMLEKYDIGLSYRNIISQEGNRLKIVRNYSQQKREINRVYETEVKEFFNIMIDSDLRDIVFVKIDQ